MNSDKQQKGSSEQSVGSKNDGQPTAKVIAISAIKKPTTWSHRPIDPGHVEKLKETISEVGLVHPPTVRPKGDGYEVLEGLHRLEAVRGLGKTEVQALVREGVDDTDAETIGLVENLRRLQLKGAELSAARNRLVELRRMKVKAGAQSTVAKELKVSKTALSRAETRKTKAAPEVEKAFKKESIGQAQVDTLCRLPTEKQVELLARVEGKTLKQTRQIVDEALNPSGAARKKVLDACGGLKAVLAEVDLRTLSDGDRTGVETVLRAVRDLLNEVLPENLKGSIAGATVLTSRGNRSVPSTDVAVA